MESVIHDRKECLVCGSQRNLHCHHVFGGTSRRARSEARGFKVWLCSQHHGEFHKHSNSGMSLYVKRKCQEYYEDHYGDRTDFIREFGKSVL